MKILSNLDDSLTTSLRGVADTGLNFQFTSPPEDEARDDVKIRHKLQNTDDQRVFLLKK